MLRLLSIVFVAVTFTSIASEINNETEVMSLTSAVSWLEEEAHRLVRASIQRMQDGTSAFLRRLASVTMRSGCEIMNIL